MPIPDERLPDLDDAEVDALDSNPEMLDDQDELEFETADADSVDDEDEILEPDEEEDTASFGYGDPAE